MQKSSGTDQPWRVCGILPGARHRDRGCYRGAGCGDKAEVLSQFWMLRIWEACGWPAGGDWQELNIKAGAWRCLGGGHQHAEEWLCTKGDLGRQRDEREQQPRVGW